MPPQKQNANRIKQKKPKFEQLQADHEMFLQAFEKPTQIYRFLRTRNQIAPIFMHRTLTYMRKRSARLNKNRPNFNVNSMLLREETRLKTQTRASCLKSDYMNLTFQEFHMPTFQDGNGGIESHEPATIEAVLLKICHKKRKDVYTPVLRDSLGQCSLLPSSSGRLYHSPSICIPSSKLSHANGHTIKSYILLLKVVCPKRVRSQKKDPTQEEICNGATDLQDHPAKRTRRHSGRTPDRTPEKEPSSSRPNSPRAPASPRGPSSPRGSASPRGPSSPRAGSAPRVPNSPRGQLYEGSVSYASELVILDKHQKCHLTDGDYEVSLQEVKSKVRNGSKGASWETLMDGKAVESLDKLNSGPFLKFHLQWANKPIDITPPSTATAPPISSSSTHSNLSPRSPHQASGGSKSPASHKLENGLEAMETSPPCVKPESVGNPPHSPMKHALRAQASPPPQTTGQSTPTRNAATSTYSKTLRVFYQFLYNNNTRQQTEARDNLHCPWCALNCQELYSLLKHLTLCHSRFKFTYVPLPKGVRIDVSINEHYDGSYAGNPQNLTSHTGYAFRRNGPCRRTPVTQILVTKPRRPKQHILTEFQEGEDKEYLGTRPYISGHNRIYYHTHTLQPMRPQEMNYDSEDEIDPVWMQERTNMMIDEFTDVNEGEKELMKIWNLFCMKHNYITDAHIPMACIEFVQEEGAVILANNLRHNLILHFVNLYDFSLIHPTVIIRSLAELDKIKKKISGGKNPTTPSSEVNSEIASVGKKEDDKEGIHKKDGSGKSWYDTEESMDDFPSCSTTESTVTNKSETTANGGDSNV